MKLVADQTLIFTYFFNIFFRKSNFVTKLRTFKSKSDAVSVLCPGFGLTFRGMK